MPSCLLAHVCLSAMRRLLRHPSAWTRAGEARRNPDGSCPVFPDNHPIHKDLTGLPAHPHSPDIIDTIGRGDLRYDWGGYPFLDPYNDTTYNGIPITYVNSSVTPFVNVTFDPTYAAEMSPSELGPFPIPEGAPVQEVGPRCPTWVQYCNGDRHMVIFDNATCLSYEFYHAEPPTTPDARNISGWRALNAAVFNMTNNRLRAIGSTSADAAGLSLYAATIKFHDAVIKGVIDHAIRITGPAVLSNTYDPNEGATHGVVAGEVCRTQAQ